MTEPLRRALRGVGAVLAAAGVVLFVLGLRGVLAPRPSTSIAKHLRDAAAQAHLETVHQGAILLAVATVTLGIGIALLAQLHRPAPAPPTSSSP